MDKKKSTHKKIASAKPFNYRPFLVAGVAILIVAAVIFAVFMRNASSPSQKVLATVNGQSVYASEINDLYNRLPATYKQQLTKESLLNQTIARDLLLQEAASQGITASDSEVMAIINNLIAQNGITQDQLSQQLADKNLTINDMISEYRKQILITKLLNQSVYSKIVVSASDISSYYNSNLDQFEQVRASHILVNSSVQAEKLLGMVKSGADFASLAKTYSLDQYSAADGGDLKNFTRSQIEPIGADFATKVFAAKVGDVFTVQTQYGYHVVKVTAHRTISFVEAKPAIKQLLASQRESVEAQQYIKSLWDKATIVFQK